MILALKILGGIVAFCSFVIVAFFLLCLIPESDECKYNKHNKN
jgi:hypothetical protein